MFGLTVFAIVYNRNKIRENENFQGNKSSSFFAVRVNEPPLLHLCCTKLILSHSGRDLNSLLVQAPQV